MKHASCFSPAHILLPAETVPLEQWGCVACDQFTSDREYWEKAEKAALDILSKDTEHYIVKSKTITTAGIELTAELRTKDASTSFVNLISRLPGVENATLVSYNGEYLS